MAPSLAYPVARAATAPDSGMAEAVARPGAMGLRSWALAGADIPSWESTARPQRPHSRSTPREFHRSKIVQHSKLAQVSGNTLDSAQKVLDSLSKTTTLLPEVCDVATVPPCSPTLPPGEKDRFFGQLSGTQVEAELRRLGMLVTGLLRDQTTLKDAVWHLQDERYEVKHKLETFERTGLNEVRTALAKSNAQLKTLCGQVEALDARVVAADDFSAQFTELACRLELMDARLTSCEEQDLYVWRSCSASVGEGPVMDAGSLVTASVPLVGAGLLSDFDRDAQQGSHTPFGIVSEDSLSPSPPALPKDRGPSEASTTSGVPLSENLSYSRPSTTPGRLNSALPENPTVLETEQQRDKDKI